ncbi:MAG TPA: cyclopropane-fatty-acyl-phospholipid synthase family protein [Anaeromyxobacteraceae bacterium]|nr:cyclopropane-fatty-acyl-phospholipid synthase family protein [Anaeromyxobacteraceae bacterium]
MRSITQEMAAPAPRCPPAFALRPKNGAASRYADGKVPITTLIEDYIDQRLEVDGDFRAFVEARRSRVTYRLVAHHLRFALAHFIPEVLIHSQAQDVRLGRAHYDRGNDFFGWFLGPRMIYTSAFFTAPGQTLEEAQDDKMKVVAQKLQLRAGDRYLDVGCGWGTLVATAARDHAVDATGITIAEKGAAYGREQIERMGLSGRARILTVDYRDIPPAVYDKISCLEMAEHVGIRRFRRFLRQIHDLLADDGIFFLQIAGLRARPGAFAFHLEDLVWGLFMNEHIFPGADASMPLSFVVRNLEAAGFEIHSVENIGIHYALTIGRWYENWMAHRAEVVAAYGERWFRLWQVFLGWSVAIATQGSSTCFQVVANKNLDGYDRMRWVGAMGLGERRPH